MPIYQIRLKEQLDQHWSAWFGGLMVTIKANGETLLTGEVVDQAALHRLLSKVHDLQLTLISVYSLMAVVTGGSSMLGLANIGPRAGLPVMEGKAAGARVVTTGRSDYPNQVNNTLVFLGLFRGGLDVRARLDNEAMKIVAAERLAALVSDLDLQGGQIIPFAMNYEVAPALAAAVAQAAMERVWLAYTSIRTSSNAPVVISSMKES